MKTAAVLIMAGAAAAQNIPLPSDLAAYISGLAQNPQASAAAAGIFQNTGVLQALEGLPTAGAAGLIGLNSAVTAAIAAEPSDARAVAQSIYGVVASQGITDGIVGGASATGVLASASAAASSGLASLSGSMASGIVANASSSAGAAGSSAASAVSSAASAGSSAASAASSRAATAASGASTGATPAPTSGGAAQIGMSGAAIVAAMGALAYL